MTALVRGVALGVTPCGPDPDTAGCAEARADGYAPTCHALAVDHDGDECPEENPVSTPIGYRPIPGFEGRYSINDCGAIWSHQRHNHVTPTANQRGHLRVTLRHADQTAAWPLVHQLVLAAFVGPCPEGMEVCHLNGDRQDVRLANLEYGISPERRLAWARRGPGRTRRRSVDTAEEYAFLKRQHLSDEEIAARLEVQVEAIRRALTRAKTAAVAA